MRIYWYPTPRLNLFQKPLFSFIHTSAAKRCFQSVHPCGAFLKRCIFGGHIPSKVTLVRTHSTIYDYYLLYQSFRLLFVISVKGGRFFEGVRIINKDINKHKYTKNKDIIKKTTEQNKQNSVSMWVFIRQHKIVPWSLCSYVVLRRFDPLVITSGLGIILICLRIPKNNPIRI